MYCRSKYKNEPFSNYFMHSKTIWFYYNQNRHAKPSKNLQNYKLAEKQREIQLADSIPSHSLSHCMHHHQQQEEEARSKNTFWNVLFVYIHTYIQTKGMIYWVNLSVVEPSFWQWPFYCSTTSTFTRNKTIPVAVAQWLTPCHDVRPTRVRIPLAHKIILSAKRTVVIGCLVTAMWCYTILLLLVFF